MLSTCHVGSHGHYCASRRQTRQHADLWSCAGNETHAGLPYQMRLLTALCRQTTLVRLDMAFRLRHKEARAYLMELLEKNNSFRILVEVGTVDLALN